jgi:hypothetical protein
VRTASSLFVALAACARPATPSGSTNGAGEPRLVVLLVIDQLPEWAFAAKRPALHGGFERLLAEGEWHVGRHPSPATLTAPGHALLGTGESPARSGILANMWWRRDLHRELHATEDADGAVTTKQLRVPGLGDAVAASGRGGKAVAVSLKDRAAILPLGHAGMAIWYDEHGDAWRTLGATPPWLAAWSRAHPLSAHARDVWTPIDPALVARLSGVRDDEPGEVGEKGLGPTFPHDLAAAKSGMFAAPIGNDVVLDTAIAAIDGEALGKRGVPDLLVISLSAHDTIAHGWGHESWEAWDAMLRLDARLARFVDELDARVGAGRWAMLATSDHGASPLPERVNGGRLTFQELRVAANNAAAAVLGAGEWIDNTHYPNVFFSAAMLAQEKSELASATRRVIAALRSFPGIERVERVAAFAGRCETRTGVAFQLCLALDPERSGELFYLPAEGWILQDEREPLATSHGSLHDYDLLVPIIIVPPGRGRTKHAAASAPTAGEIDMARVSTIVARWLGVTPPLSMPR